MKRGIPCWWKQLEHLLMWSDSLDSMFFLKMFYFQCFWHHVWLPLNSWIHQWHWCEVNRICPGTGLPQLMTSTSSFFDFHMYSEEMTDMFPKSITLEFSWALYKQNLSNFAWDNLAWDLLIHFKFCGFALVSRWQVLLTLTENCAF